MTALPTEPRMSKPGLEKTGAPRRLPPLRLRHYQTNPKVACFQWRRARLEPDLHAVRSEPSEPSSIFGHPEPCTAAGLCRRYSTPNRRIPNEPNPIFGHFPPVPSPPPDRTNPISPAHAQFPPARPRRHREPRGQDSHGVSQRRRNSRQSRTDAHFESSDQRPALSYYAAPPAELSFPASLPPSPGAATAAQCGEIKLKCVRPLFGSIHWEDRKSSVKPTICMTPSKLTKFLVK